MYNITPGRFEAELRKIARMVRRRDQWASDALELLANRLHEPADPCECAICRDRYYASHPIKTHYYTPEEAARVYRDRHQD